MVKRRVHQRTQNQIDYDYDDEDDTAHCWERRRLAGQFPPPIMQLAGGTPALLEHLTADRAVVNCPVYVTYKRNADWQGHQLAMHLRAAYAHLRRRSNLAFSAFGMTADQYVLLTVLAHEGEATQQELVRRCYSDTATIGTMVSLLEAKRLVTRTPHPEDGRALSVKLTRSGRRLAEEMRQSSTGIRAELSALFDDQELRMLIEFLDRLAGAMQPPGRKDRRVSLPPGAEHSMNSSNVSPVIHSQQP